MEMIRCFTQPSAKQLAARGSLPTTPYSKSGMPLVALDMARADMTRWTPARRDAYFLVNTFACKAVVSFVIALNTVTVVYETDTVASCEQHEPIHECSLQEASFVSYANQAFLAVYILEMVLRIYAYRAFYFFSRADVADFCIIIVGLLGEFFAGVSGFGILRIFRVVKVARAVTAATNMDEVKIFISGIGTAFKAIIVGATLIFFCLFLWAIVAVIIVHPVNQQVAQSGLYEEVGCARCPVAYASVGMATLTLLQTIVMGDAWGEYAVPIIEQQPLTIIIFVCASFSISLGFTNLIMAVIVERALDNREDNISTEAQKRIKEVEVARKKFVALCRDIDQDNSGSLTLKELLDGASQDERLRSVLTCLDISNEDLSCVFDILDTDRSGDVSYAEFAYELQNLKSQDMHTMVSFIKHYVYEIHSLHLDFHRFLASSDGVLLPAENLVGLGMAGPLAKTKEERPLHDAGLGCGEDDVVDVKVVLASTPTKAAAEPRQEEERQADDVDEIGDSLGRLLSLQMCALHRTLVDAETRISSLKASLVQLASSNGEDSGSKTSLPATSDVNLERQAVARRGPHVPLSENTRRPCSPTGEDPICTAKLSINAELVEGGADKASRSQELGVNGRGLRL